jgi:hypothetical protein
VAARVVGDREDVDPRVGRQLAGQLKRASSAVGRDQATARDELRRNDERLRARELLA